MEELGLVRASASTHDQRRVRVSLTRKQPRPGGAHGAADRGHLCRIEARIGADFMQRFYAMLDHLIATLDAGDAATGAGRP